jgi:casein kinase II subunit beta
MNEDLEEELQGIKEVYGLIHKRFITTSKGLALMREKYLNGVFGRCPRVVCDKQVLIPVGLSEDLRYSKVKVYCPICCQVYKPSRHKGRSVSLDGAYFGTSFAQIFFMNYPDLKPKIKEEKTYIPKLYGFRIFGKYGSKYYCKNKKELNEKKKMLNISIDDE